MKERIFILTVICQVMVGCACTDRDHLATTNWMDRTIVPNDRTAQWALTPILVPLCVGTLAVDNFVVAPAVHLPSAWADAGEFFTDEVGGYYTEMGILPIRTVLTPVVFLGSWFGRSLFGLRPRSDAAWRWPTWGRQWERDEYGRLLRRTEQPA